MSFVVMVQAKKKKKKPAKNRKKSFKNPKAKLKNNLKRTVREVCRSMHVTAIFSGSWVFTALLTKILGS